MTEENTKHLPMSFQQVDDNNPSVKESGSMMPITWRKKYTVFCTVVMFKNVVLEQKDSGRSLKKHLSSVCVSVV